MYVDRNKWKSPHSDHCASTLYLLLRTRITTTDQRTAVRRITTRGISPRPGPAKVFRVRTAR